MPVSLWIFKGRGDKRGPSNDLIFKCAFISYHGAISPHSDETSCDITEESEGATTMGISTAGSSKDASAVEGARHMATAIAIKTFFILYTSFIVIISNVYEFYVEVYK